VLISLLQETLDISRLIEVKNIIQQFNPLDKIVSVVADLALGLIFGLRQLI
jgi:hypothetical protein